MSWQSEVRAWAVASAAAFCLATAGYRVYTAPDLTPVITHLDQASAAWANASAEQVKSVAAIERDLRAEMWHLDRTLGTADDTLRASTGAIGHVGPLLDTANSTIAQLNAPIAQASSTIAQLQAPIAQASSTIAQLQAPIAQLNADLAALEPVEQHVDALVSDPNIAATIAHVESTTGHLDATAKDVQHEVYSYTHPTWAHKIFSWSLSIAHALSPL